MSYSHQSLLSYLANHAGKQVTYHEIKKVLEKNSYFKQKRRTYKKRSDTNGLHLEAMVSELLEFGLVQKKNHKLFIKAPFLVKAQLSVAKSGAGFAISRGTSDIFIPNPLRGGANTRDQVMVKIKDRRRNRYEGEVVRVVKSFTTTFTAKVLEKKNDIYLVSLIDMPDQPLSALKGVQKKELKAGSYVAVRMKDENISIPISGKLRSSIQQISCCSLLERAFPKNDNIHLKRVSLKYSLPEEYSKEKVPSKKSMQNKFHLGLQDKSRKNLEKLHTCTIDGDDAKDFDDAISLQKTGGQLKLYVHIADVSYFVEKNSPVDTEALERGNSYYLKPWVLPMLPPILSEEYCSLKPKTKRLAVTCEMNFSETGKFLDSKFYRSVIYIHERFTYKKAEIEIHKKNTKLQEFWLFAQKLRNIRLQKGGIDLDIPEPEIVFDRRAKVKDIRLKARLESHKLIEEFMLAANRAVAGFCKMKRIPVIYRVHEPMDKTKLTSLNQLLKLLGAKYQLRNTEYPSLKKAIALLSKQKDKEVFSFALLRSFMQAVYEPNPRGHWGLGSQDYAHFTSPIRRYADLVLHRQMLSWLDKKKIPHGKKELKTISIHISEKERTALDAERSMFKLLSMDFFEKNHKDEYICRLIGFNQSGLFIMLSELPIEGFIPAGSFDRSSQVNAISEYQVVITKYSKMLMLGQELKARYIKPDQDNMQLIFHCSGFV